MDAAQISSISGGKTGSAACSADPRSPRFNCLRAFYSAHSFNLCASSALDNFNRGNRDPYPNPGDSSTATGAQLVSDPQCDPHHVFLGPNPSARGASAGVGQVHISRPNAKLHFLVWVLRSWHLLTGTAETHGRGWRIIRAIANIGLIFLPAAFLANIFGYVNLGDLLGIIFLRSVFVAFMLYSVIRIIEGLITIALQVRPLASLRVISLHRPMFERRTCRVLEFLAFLWWLNLVLNFFGLLTPLTATIEAVLRANLIIGSLNISLGQVLLFTVTVWASFLASSFLRFLLEEDVYYHWHFGRGIPQAVSTIIHYVVLLVGFFVALAVLGVDFTKVTILILPGAFTVGV